MLGQIHHLLSDHSRLVETVPSHQQDLVYSSLEKTELCEPVLVSDLALPHISLDREILTSTVKISQAGAVTAILYWFVQDFGWNLKLSTMESEEFRQAAVICQDEVAVSIGDSVTISCQLQSGLIDFKLQAEQ